MAKRLLILACSATKSADAGYVSAIERYAGPLWQTLRTVDPVGTLAFASVLSAHHGWKPADELMLPYEQRMTQTRSAELRHYGITEGWPKYKGAGDGGNACEWLARASGRTWDGKYAAPFTEVCIVGGADYVEVAKAFVAEAMERGYLAADCRVVIINDQIGYMRKALRAWLTEATTSTAVPVAA